MKLQLAYDRGTYEGLYPFMEEIEEAVDIIEIGTPVILREWVSQIKNVKKRFPDKWQIEIFKYTTEILNSHLDNSTAFTTNTLAAFFANLFLLQNFLIPI